MPRTIRLEEFRKMDGTQVKSARNYTQVEDSLDLDRERLRFEEERIKVTEGTFTYVAINDQRRPIPFKKQS